VRLAEQFDMVAAHPFTLHGTFHAICRRKSCWSSYLPQKQIVGVRYRAFESAQTHSQ
jgi:hypothetical protein